jgi:hypothetical protein
MTSLKTKLGMAFITAAATVAGVFGGTATAHAAPLTPLKQDWTKTMCIDRPTGRYGKITHCYGKTYPGDKPGNWDTPAFVPFSCNPNGYWVVCTGGDPGVRHWTR